MRRILAAFFVCGSTWLAGPAWAFQTSSPADALSDPNPAVRERAADALGAAEGAEAASAAAALSKALGDQTDTVRWRAARALARLGPSADVAVPALSQALSDSSPLVRAHAALALGAVGKAAQPAADGLFKLVVDPEASVRRASLRALRSLRLDPGVVLPRVSKILGDADPAVASLAVQTMVEAGPAALPALAQALAQPESRYWATLGVADLGPQAGSLAPEVAQILEDPSAKPHVVVQAITALGEMGPSAAVAEPQLLRVLQGNQVWAQYPAVFAAGRIGLKSAVPALRDLARSNDPLLSAMSVWAMARIEPKNAELVKRAFTTLAANLRAEDSVLKLASARALGELEAPPELISPEFIEVVRGLDPEVRAALAEGIASRGAAVVPRLAQALSLENRRVFALGILARIGPAAAPAAGQIAAAARASGDAEFQREAAFALAAIGPGAAPATDYLVELLTTGAPPLRYAASYALGRIGPGAAKAESALRPLLTGDDAFLRTAAAWALLKIDPAKNADVQPTAIGLFTAALADERPQVRAAMAQALAEQGPAAKTALPALERALHDPDEGVRDAAAEAIEQIDAQR
jgi:HEAT repeat protein